MPQVEQLRGRHKTVSKANKIITSTLEEKTLNFEAELQRFFFPLQRLAKPRKKNKTDKSMTQYYTLKENKRINQLHKHNEVIVTF